MAEYNIIIPGPDILLYYESHFRNNGPLRLIFYPGGPNRQDPTRAYLRLFLDRIIGGISENVFINRDHDNVIYYR